ncbi:MAG: hypothetical protein JWN98_1885 [Abditibacteriota bacterium]|nr:hypothetical protein [Abditibacteriota bacterium]
MLPRWILASCIGLAMAGQVRPAQAGYVEVFDRVTLPPKIGMMATREAERTPLRPLPMRER